LFPRPFCLALRIQLANRLLEFANIINRQLARFGKLRHHGLRAASEETQNLVQQTMPRNVASHYGLKNMRVADFFHAMHRLLGFKPVNRPGRSLMSKDPHVDRPIRP
jgi:hypothetical protein